MGDQQREQQREPEAVKRRGARAVAVLHGGRMFSCDEIRSQQKIKYERVSNSGRKNQISQEKKHIKKRRRSNVHY